MTSSTVSPGTTDPATPNLTITPRQRQLILLGALLGMLVAAINQTTVTTVLPTIARDLHGLDLYTWVFTISMLASAVAVPVFGKLSDLYGRRNLFIVGMVTFMVGVAGCGLAQSMHQLIFARGVQGIGMGAIMPLTMAIIADIVPASDRGRWQGLMGAVFGFATVLGPIAGGAISDHFGWRWIFWINLPLGVIALATIITQMHLPFVPRRARIDWLGAVTLGGGLTSLLLALSEGGRNHPWSSTYVLGLFVAATVLLVAFVLVEWRAADPLIPLNILAERNVAITSIAGFAIGAGMFAAIFYVPLFMQAVVGVSSSDSGRALVPLMLGLILSSVISGIVIGRTHAYKTIIVIGPVIAMVGLWMMARMDANVSLFGVSWRSFIVGIGIGMVMQNLVLVAQNSVDLRDTGVVTSLSTLMRAVGGTVGVSILGTAFSSQLPNHIKERMAELPPALQAAMAKGGSHGGKIDSSMILDNARSHLPTPVREAIRLGISDTLLHVFVLGIPFLAVAFVVTLILRRDRLSDIAAVSVVEEFEHELAGIVPVDADHAPESPVH